MSEDWTKAERREMLRRLEYAIELHPWLSGLQTDEHKHWLRELAHTGLRLDEQPEKGEEPDYFVELGYDTLEEDEYPKPLSEALPQVDEGEQND